LAYVSSEEDTKAEALDFCLAKAHFLQKIPYHQCGIVVRKDDHVGEESKESLVDVRKFTSLGEEEWKTQHERISDEEYMMMRNREVSVPLDEDCFTKMDKSFSDAKGKVKSRFAVLHSRYSSSRKILDNLAHPHVDEKGRVGVFHNGFIANYEDLGRQLKQDHGITIETDS
jgi:Glutamine amidotransferase domain